MRTRLVTLLMAWGLVLPGSVAAQVLWDAPLLVPPEPRPGVGVYLLDAAGGGIGVLGTWRSASAQQSLGLRLGVVEGGWDQTYEDISGLAGLDLSGSLVRASADFPLDVSWVVGAGVGFGSWAWISIPAGVTLGRALVAETVRITPYFSPRVVVDGSMGRENAFGEDTDELDLDFAMDLGVELGFAPNWRISFGGTVNRRSAIAIGLAF